MMYAPIAPVAQWLERVRDGLRSFLAGALLLACNHPPPQPVTPDADAAMLGDAPSDCVQLCSHLASIGCLEGADPECAAFFAKNRTVPVSPVDFGCAQDAGTKEAARACGLRCP